MDSIRFDNLGACLERDAKKPTICSHSLATDPQCIVFATTFPVFPSHPSLPMTDFNSWNTCSENVFSAVKRERERSGRLAAEGWHPLHLTAHSIPIKEILLKRRNGTSWKSIVDRLQFYLGYPTGLHVRCPVFTQQKFSYISHLPIFLQPDD